MEKFANAIEYLRLAAERGSRLGLERITELCGLLGDPQNNVPVIHVAGTNGKGSFGAMLASVLKCAGYKVGSFSSPAITGVTDSFRINCEEITEEEFGDLICGIIPKCESMQDKPTEFEILTAAAYSLFSQRKCDVAIVECGMGGETDSTNVVSKPILSVITNVALDHTAYLGSTIGEIAAVKAGIIKRYCPVLYGGNDLTAQRVICARAAENLCWYITTNHSLTTDVRSDIDGTTLNYADFKDVHTPLTGTYQQYNIANVLNAVKILRSIGLKITPEAVREGLEKVRWRGRFEVMNREPLIVFDGAHNPDGIRSAAESIEKYFDKKVVLIMGVMADKDYGAYPKLLKNAAAMVFTVTPDNPRALDGEQLAEAFSSSGIYAQAYPDFDEGVRSAVACAKENGLPIAALGSLYMYKQFTEALERAISE